MSCDNKALTWYLYLIQSQKTGKIYTGISPDPQERLRKHNTGVGAKATRGLGPWVLIYTERAESKSAALRREIAVKKLPRSGKLRLVE